MKKKLMMFKPDAKQLKRLIALCEVFDKVLSVITDSEKNEHEKITEIEDLYQKFGEEWGL